MAIKISVLGDPSAPLTYTTPGSTAFIPRAASCVFDGSGAGGAYLPCMTWIAQDGSVIGRYVAPEVAAGASVETSWFPHVAAAAATATGTVEEVAYFEWNGASTGAIPGTRKFNVSLTSSSNTAVFDANAGSARVKAAGAIQSYQFIDWGATETVTGGVIAEYRFGLDFPVFPFYTVGGPWKTIPATPTALVYDTEVTGEFYVSTPTLTMRPFVRSPAMAPGGDPAGIFLVLVKLRDTWAF